MFFALTVRRSLTQGPKVKVHLQRKDETLPFTLTFKTQTFCVCVSLSHTHRETLTAAKYNSMCVCVCSFLFWDRSGCGGGGVALQVVSSSPWLLLWGCSGSCARGSAPPDIGIRFQMRPGLDQEPPCFQQLSRSRMSPQRLQPPTKRRWTAASEIRFIQCETFLRNPGAPTPSQTHSIDTRTTNTLNDPGRCDPIERATANFRIVDTQRRQPAWSGGVGGHGALSSFVLLHLGGKVSICLSLVCPRRQRELVTSLRYEGETIY